MESGKNEEVILPHDWKRRILITTGNHDYAAMNDVRVQTESRKITTGLPARSAGGTMSKYTYFLEFLSYFLDAPTQKLLGSDLNEVREYNQLDLIVGIFNSCSQANALQNNKVSFASKKLQLVLERSNWKKSTEKHIVLAHHSPSYSIDYFDDKYGRWKYKKYKSFVNISELYDIYIGAINEYLSNGESIPSKIRENFKVEFEELLKTLNENSEWEFFESELFKDMEMLYNLLKDKYRHFDEYINRYLSEANSLFKTIIDDNEVFKEDWERIAHDNLTVIAGHTHKADYFPRDRDKKYDTIIGHRFYNEKIDSAPIVFEVISPKSVSASVRVRHVLCRGQQVCEELCKVCKVKDCAVESDCQTIKKACPQRKSTICGMDTPCNEFSWLSDDFAISTNRIENILNKWKS